MIGLEILFSNQKFIFSLVEIFRFLLSNLTLLYNKKNVGKNKENKENLTLKLVGYNSTFLY
jgi:hypothetical protein